MGATADRYSRMVKMLKLSDGTKGVLHKFALQLAAYLQGYNTSGLTEAQKSGIVADRFYLDDLITNTDGDGNAVFVGRVIKDSDNYNHHGTGRIGKKWQKDDAGRLFNLLNDAGLNTKPHAEFSGNIVASYTNFIKVLCNLDSAYYVATDKFTIDIYTVANDVETWIHSVDLAVSDATDRRYLPAQSHLSQFVAKIRDLGGVSAGTAIRLKISATNSEGTYINPTHKEATLLAAMSFIQVYYFQSQPDFVNTDPTTGTPYVMLISRDMYAQGSSQGVGSGGVLHRLFVETDAGDPMAGAIANSERLQGAALMSGETVEDAYDKALSDLPAGFYYGVPYKDFEGADGFAYVQVVDSNHLKWYANRYAPVVPSAYSVIISFSGTYDTTLQKYYVDVFAQISGTIPNGGVLVTTIVCTGISRQNEPVGIQFGGSISARITGSSPVKLNSESIECEDGAFFQSYGTYGSPVSTTDNYVTEGNIHVNSTTIPHAN